MKTLMSKQARHFYEFGSFRVDETERVLYHNGAPVLLPPKVFDTLLVLVRESGHIVEKEELIKQVWPDTFVEENNLSQYISTLRKVLGNGSHEQRLIETVPRRGYRFAPGVQEIWDENDGLVSATNTKVSLIIKEETEEEEDSETGRREDVETRTRTDTETRGYGDAKTRRYGKTVSVAASRRRRLAVSLVAAVLVLASLAGSAFWVGKLRNSESRKNVPPALGSLAVLPFTPVGASGEDAEFFGLGIAHNLIVQLDQNMQIKVRPTSANDRYLGPGHDPIAAGRELKVDAVLTGNFKTVGERIEVRLQLSRTSDGTRIWQESFEGSYSNLFALQDVIAEKVAREVFSVAAAPLKQVLSRRSTGNVEAYNAYVKGRYHWNKRSVEGLHRSIAFFEQAITLDPQYALAYAGLADVYAFDYRMWRKAEELARKALEIDNTLGEAHATIGFVRMFWLWDWVTAEREFKLAVTLKPRHATARQWYAIYLMAYGHGREALEEMRQALELDPFSISINADLAQIFYVQGQHDQAIQQCQHTLVLDPNFLNAHIYLYQAYTKKGMYDEAVDEYFKLQELAGHDARFSVESGGALREAYAKGGIRGFWRERIRQFLMPGAVLFSPSLAEYHALLGERDKALYWLGKAVEEREFEIVFIHANPIFRDLRTDHRFLELVRRVLPHIP
jgi:DNA-binding winged helix-turn-helix (wHTH) protein/TolB-like protein/Tfp pilus assembly protein PilF